MLVTTSPGLVAWPLGIFSVAGIRPITSCGKPSSAIVRIVPSTVAAPHISYFISSMPRPGLREIPPVSKVTPLPTRTIGFCSLVLLFLPAGLYLIIIKRGAWSEPAATERNEPIFKASICFFSKTSTCRVLNSFARTLA